MAQFNSKNQSSRVARRWFTDIDTNMTLHPQSGDLTLKFDINSIKRSIRNLLSTNLYERPFKPSLGVDLRGMLFELSTTDSDILENDIKAVINKFEPRASVTDVVTFLEGNSLDVSMFLIIQNDPMPHEINITLQRTR
jgi:phage baseplate assembly protein W|tara:strand:- start:1810 stop:2223 length:414 start_codon:yes stop_codon:yes gene_type:complete